MDDDHRELVRRLFVVAAEITETAPGAAIAGQSEVLTAGAYAEAARRLEAAARSLAAPAEVAAVIAGPVKDGTRSDPESPHCKSWTSPPRQAWIGGGLRAAPARVGTPPAPTGMPRDPRAELPSA